MTLIKEETLSTDLQTMAINTIRMLAVDAVQKADSGHPGLPMGAAPMAYALWMNHMRFNPHNPQWANRDRFILSAGHGSMLLYALLYLTGYDLPLEELKNFRQWGSKTPGHPEYHDTPGVETTTGPLGQGASNAVGFAVAEAYLAKYFNRPGYDVVDHYTFALVSDGDVMEGVCSEAASLAGHWGLGKLIYLYDANKITLDGSADMTFTENVAARFEAYGWHTIRVEEGNDYSKVNEAIAEAKKVTDKPSLLSIHTTIGYGSPNKANTSAAHGSPLGKEEVKLTKEALGWPQEDFYVPGDVLEHFREAVERGAQEESDWSKTFEAWRAEYPELAAEWDQAMSGELPSGWDADIPVFSPGKAIATRNASGDALNAIAQHIPTMIGGDADLAGSTKTLIKGAENTGHLDSAERNLRFGVREHGMGAIVNGLALHGGIIKPFSATFLTFSDYMRPAIRLGALMDIPTVYVFTHDSIGLGEDGPTHQPVEHFAALRAIPNLTFIRPADANETSAAWRLTMTLPGPVALAFSRQNLPVIENGEMVQEKALYGGYVLDDCEGTPQVILLSSGSEVQLAREAYKTLMAEGIKARVVSMPSWEVFDSQDEAYRESVLPKRVSARVSIEAGVVQGWEKYVGSGGITIGLDRFGASAPYEEVYEHLGITAARMVEAAKSLL
ncbi:MAG: transketolase [Anaerolineae bacterium]|nr:transketolase [Anaerolineae bacterium]